MSQHQVYPSFTDKCSTALTKKHRNGDWIVYFNKIIIKYSYEIFLKGNKCCSLPAQKELSLCTSRVDKSTGRIQPEPAWRNGKGSINGSNREVLADSKPREAGGPVHPVEGARWVMVRTNRNIHWRNKWLQTIATDGGMWRELISTSRNDKL